MIRTTNRGNYEPVQLHYSKGKPDGILVFEDNLELVLGLKDLGEMYWDGAMKKVASLGLRLLNKEEWKLVDKYCDQINQLLESVGGDTITDKYYWSSVEYNRYTVWHYYGNTGTLNPNGKYYTFTVRPTLTYQSN